MSNTVTLIVDEKFRFDVPTKVSLLSVLNEKKIYLPSICGGRGICGKCRCRVLEGGDALKAAEMKRLSQEDILSQVRLACQVQIEQGLQIQIPEGILQLTEYESQLTLLKTLTHDIKLLRLKLLNPPQIHFKPGQFVQLKSQPYENVHASVMRSYSIASSASSADHIDLMVRLVPEGICSTWVHEHLRAGDRVAFVGPNGDFFVRDGHEDVVLVAGGSGMAPMVSILYELSQKTPDRKVDFFFGACKEKDLFFLDEMDAFGKQMSRFRFRPVLSQPENVDACETEMGLVTETLNAYLRTVSTGKLHLYLCGSPGMIQNGKSVASRNGVPAENIFHDSFS